MAKVHFLKTKERQMLGIISGIPMPKPSRPSLLREQLKACSVGDSFLTKKTNKTTVYYFTKLLGIKANCRPAGDEYIRVWRVL